MEQLTTENIANCKARQNTMQGDIQLSPSSINHCETQIPGYTSKIIHTDIFSTDQKYFLNSQWYNRLIQEQS